jgi:hypothetical protein
VFEIRPTSGWVSDDHDLHLTPRRTAVIVVNKVVPFDLRPDLLFHWTVSNHYSLQESYHAFTPGWAENPEQPFEPFVLNSAQATSQGNYLVSIRHMSSIAHIDGRTGNVTWKLGGKKNGFIDLSLNSSRAASTFNGQHHARILDLNNGKERNSITLTIFDNGFGGQEAAHATTGKVVQLDLDSMTAQLLHQPYQNGNHLLQTHSRGSMQILPNGNRLLGYGTVPAWTEFATDGSLLCDVHFAPRVGFNTEQAFSYRVLRRPWLGQPKYRPSVVIKDDHYLLVSWNGATEVVSWALEAQTHRSANHDDQMPVTLTTVKKSGFETVMYFPQLFDWRCIRVLALDSRGKMLGSSGFVDRPVLNSGCMEDPAIRTELR